jgi:hypothetical protein
VCAEQAIQETIAECAANGIDESSCMGVSGTGYLTAPLDECGWRADPTEGTEAELRLIDDECQRVDSLDEMSMFAQRLFIQYDPKGGFMSAVASRCKQVYSENTAKRLDEERRHDQYLVRRHKEEAQASKVQLQIGLSESAVYERFGAPSSITESVSASGVSKVLDYGPNLTVIIVDGRVSSWTKEQRSRVGVVLDPSGRVVQVIPGSPAERAGITIGDEISLVDGAPVATAEEVGKAVLSAALSQHRSVLVHLQHGDEQRVVAVLFE